MASLRGADACNTGAFVASLGRRGRVVRAYSGPGSGEECACGLCAQCARLRRRGTGVSPVCPTGILPVAYTPKMGVRRTAKMAVPRFELWQSARLRRRDVTERRHEALWRQPLWRRNAAGRCRVSRMRKTGKGVSLTGAGKKGQEEAFLSACGGERPCFPIFPGFRREPFSPLPQVGCRRS